MKKSLNLLVLISFLTCSCKTAKVVLTNACSAEEVSAYIPNHGMKSAKKKLIIVLESGFNSKVSVYMNDRLIKDTLVDNLSPVGIPVFLGYTYKDKEEKIIKIRTGNNCFETKINTKFKILRVLKSKNSWILSYTSKMPMYE